MKMGQYTLRSGCKDSAARRVMVWHDVIMELNPGKFGLTALGAALQALRNALLPMARCSFLIRVRPLRTEL
jgi:hypothetical protein